MCLFLTFSFLRVVLIICGFSVTENDYVEYCPSYRWSCYLYDTLVYLDSVLSHQFISRRGLVPDRSLPQPKVGLIKMEVPWLHSRLASVILDVVRKKKGKEWSEKSGDEKILRAAHAAKERKGYGTFVGLTKVCSIAPRF